MYNILVVDDEEKIRTLIRKYGEFEGLKWKRQQMVFKPFKNVKMRNLTL